jgi:hypothetical protein
MRKPLQQLLGECDELGRWVARIDDAAR